MKSAGEKMERLDAGLLKAMVLTALNDKDMNSSEIYTHITTMPYSYQSDVPALAEKYKNRLYPGSIQALRTALVYLRGRYMIKKTHKKRLLIYALTDLGRKEQISPFRNEEVFEERVQEAVEERLKGTNVPTVIPATQPIVGDRVYPDRPIEPSSVLFIGSSNDLALNCSNNPKSTQFHILRVVDGVPVLD
jgi:hypothetical protein